MSVRSLSTWLTISERQLTSGLEQPANQLWPREAAIESGQLIGSSVDVPNWRLNASISAPPNPDEPTYILSATPYPRNTQPRRSPDHMRPSLVKVHIASALDALPATLSDWHAYIGRAEPTAHTLDDVTVTPTPSDDTYNHDGLTLDLHLDEVTENSTGELRLNAMSGDGFAQDALSTGLSTGFTHKPREFVDATANDLLTYINQQTKVPVRILTPDQPIGYVRLEWGDPILATIDRALEPRGYAFFAGQFGLEIRDVAAIRAMPPNKLAVPSSWEFTDSRHGRWASTALTTSADEYRESFSNGVIFGGKANEHRTIVLVDDGDGLYNTGAAQTYARRTIHLSRQFKATFDYLDPALLGLRVSVPIGSPYPGQPWTVRSTEPDQPGQQESIPSLEREFISTITGTLTRMTIDLVTGQTEAIIETEE